MENRLLLGQLETCGIAVEDYAAAKKAADELYPDRREWTGGWNWDGGVAAAKALTTKTGLDIRWGFLGTYRHGVLSTIGRANYGIVMVGSNNRYRKPV